MAHGFDLSTLAVTGSPVAIADGVNYFRSTGRAAFSVASGTIVYGADPPDVDPVMMDRRGVVLSTLGHPGYFADTVLSPDGTRVMALIRERRSGFSDLWLFDLDRRTSTRMTNDPAAESSIVWSPDGRSVAYTNDANGPDIYVNELSSSNSPHAILTARGGQFPRAWLADGRLLFTDAQEGRSTLEILSLRGPTPIRSSPRVPIPNVGSLAISPDGRSIAQFDVTPDGQRFLVTPGAPPDFSAVQVIVNWRPR